MTRELGVRLATDVAVPSWLAAIADRVDGATVPQLLPRVLIPDGEIRRRSAVLMLMSEGPAGPDILLTARAATLRSHAGQPAFPGGAQDPGEDVITTALREGQEETGLDPASVTPVALFPELFLPPSGYLVAPVLAFWHQPGPVGPVDAAETAAVARVPIAELVDPANRGQIRHPSGFTGPAFEVADMMVWGFTAGLVQVLLDLGGWTRPWNRERYLELPELAQTLRDPEAEHFDESEDRRRSSPGTTR